MVIRLTGLLPVAFLESGCSGGPGTCAELDFGQGYYSYRRGGPPHCPPGQAKEGRC